MNEVVYTVERLLANPRLFYAIANYLEGPDGDTLREAFYDLLEHEIAECEEPKESHFEAVEVCFRVSDDGAVCEIVFDTGIMSVLEAVEGELRAMISDDGEMAAATAIYQRLVSAIEEANPEFEGDIALCSPPTPGNAYLRSPDGDKFEGEFHLLSDPEQVYAFRVEVIDVKEDKLKATIKRV
jgi:hypothetical protein